MKSQPQFVCYAPIDLKLADIYMRDGYSNGNNTPTTPNIEPVAETNIALSGMASAVPDPAVTTGVSVKFGTDTTEYTVTARTLGTGTNEVQTIEIDDDVSAGTFTLSFGGYTTDPIAYNASAAVVEAALEALNSTGLGACTVSGASPKWTVTFTGNLAATDVALITGTNVDMSGGITTDPEITETTAGVDGVNEEQTLTVTGTPTGGYTNISFGGDTTENIAWDAAAADVELALEAMDSIPQGEATCAGGPWPGTAITVTFSGTLGKTDQPMMTNVDNFTGGTSPELTITESTQGVAEVKEVITIALNDSVTGGTFTLTHSTNETAPILYNATALEIETALEALASITSVTVTGGPSPKTDWVITFDTAGAQTDITGDGTNLTGGSGTAVSVTEITKGVTSNETTQITITPGLVVATTMGGSVIFGGRKLAIKVGEGNLTFTENTPREYLKNRGLLDTVRNADEEPMDVSFDFVWEFLAGSLTGNTPTIKEVLKRQGKASTWVSTSSDLCEPYCTDIVIYYDPACGGENTERVDLKYFRSETLEHNLRDAQCSCTGKCNVTGAVETRGV